ncbi:hypothetical protein [Nostoc sp. CALU 1950]|uniref:hypothetical protein n=1 Tax=Nostoc sp. CALU 1950 TaxID=3104321 RepID=UPI003EBFC44B
MPTAELETSVITEEYLNLDFRHSCGLTFSPTAETADSEALATKERHLPPLSS